MLRLVIICLIVMNVAGFVVFGYDKRCARLNRWRVSERTLLLIALLGGSVGSCAGMYVFRHKTRHWKFRIGLPIIMLLQFCLVYYLQGSQ